MYLYFYPPDSLTHKKFSVTHRNKMVNGKVFGPKRLKVQHFKFVLGC